MPDLDPAHPLAPFKAKLDRANESVRTLSRGYTEFSQLYPLRADVKVDFQSGWNTAYNAEHQPIPLSLAVLAGEALYHARSVLEHLVWALVKANHKKPGHYNSFPILLEVPMEGFAGRTNRPGGGKTPPGALRGVSARARARIEQVQPYHAPVPGDSFLAVLNRMARDDRHHALHSDWVGGAEGDLEHLLQVPPGVEVTAFRPLLENGRRLVTGAKLARFRCNPISRQPRVAIRGDLPAFIAFGHRKTGILRLDDFHKINESVAKLVSAFEGFL